MFSAGSDHSLHCNRAQFDPRELFWGGKKQQQQQQLMNGAKHPFTFAFKMQVGHDRGADSAPVYEQSQLGAAADYFLIK